MNALAENFSGVAPSSAVLADDKIVDSAIAPKRLTPQQRLQKLVKTHITKIETNFNNKDSVVPHPYFHACVVLEALEEKLIQAKSGLGSKHDNYSLLEQLISNEVKTIRECLDSGCVGGESSKAAKVFSTLKNKGTTFVAPSVKAPAYQAA